MSEGVPKWCDVGVVVVAEVFSWVVQWLADFRIDSLLCNAACGESRRRCSVVTSLLRCCSQSTTRNPCSISTPSDGKPKIEGHQQHTSLPSYTSLFKTSALLFFVLFLVSGCRRLWRSLVERNTCVEEVTHQKSCGVL